MRVWLQQHRRALGSTLRRLYSAPASSLFSILVIAAALSLPAGLYVLLQNAQNLAQQVAGAPQISVFLNLEASQEDITRIGNRLAQHGGIQHIEFVPRAQALDQLKRTTGLNDVISGLTQNPLPDAYIIQPRQESVADLAALRDELQGWPKIAHVQLDSDWVRKLEALFHFAQQTLVVVASLLGVALVAVTFNTIRLQILTRREEIEVSRLIGATDTFIRRPFLYLGVLQGLLGGFLSSLILTGCLFVLGSSLSRLVQLYASDYSLHGLSIHEVLILLIFSSALGWLGAWLSIAQHLKPTRSG